MGRDIKTLTKQDWSNNTELPSTEDLQTSALMRIADASEKMATNYLQLQNDRDWYKKKYHEKQDEIKHLNNRISSLKGNITKLKNKHSN